jgi:hypothetical protein
MGFIDRRPVAGQKARKDLIQVGFWRDIMAKHSILDDLPDPRDLVQPGWMKDQRPVILAYLNSGRRVEQYLGYSYCRFGCSEMDMGTADLSDGTYIWPEGLAHYVQHHEVPLPDDFLAHIVSQYLNNSK